MDDYNPTFSLATPPTKVSSQESRLRRAQKLLIEFYKISELKNNNEFIEKTFIPTLVEQDIVELIIDAEKVLADTGYNSHVWQITPYHTTNILLMLLFLTGLTKTTHEKLAREALSRIKTLNIVKPNKTEVELFSSTFSFCTNLYWIIVDTAASLKNLDFLNTLSAENFKALWISKCSKLSDISQLKRFKNFTELSMYKIPKLTDTSIFDELKFIKLIKLEKVGPIEQKSINNN